MGRDDGRPMGRGAPDGDGKHNGDGEVGRLQLEILQLQQALATRDLIGQAKGVLMATSGLSAEEAFRLLVRQSQRSNRKLTEIAAEVIATQGRVGSQG